MFGEVVSTMKPEGIHIQARRDSNTTATNGDAAPRPSVIINADDWGRNLTTTNNTLDCVRAGAVSSVSAMVFMEDSERAALLAREHAIDAGLHLNFTLAFSSANCPIHLREHQARVGRFLRSHRFAPIFYHPGLARSFRLLADAQIDEFQRLYGEAPRRIDGHHHMHLSANVLLGKLLPADTMVRRNFTFRSGEKSLFNRTYRRWQDRLVTRRHRSTEMFFALPPLVPDHLARIFDFGARFSVEIETHPAVREEYDFLLSGKLEQYTNKVAVARSYSLPSPTLNNPGTLASSRRADIASTLSDPCDDPIQASLDDPPHISVCICTYKRPDLLRSLLTDLAKQHTCGLFTYSIVVADNDPLRSAEFTVADMQATLSIPVKYCSEPRRSIALARNKVVANATGNYLAFIDDDEFPIRNWLLSLFTTLNEHHVDGVLGPVKRHFDEPPPDWLKKSTLYDRRVNPTGTRVSWGEARTGNVLLKRELITGDPLPFRPEFRAGEDQDFFRRKIDEGRRFIWSSDAAVFEVIPPARWRRSYIVRKALLHGVNTAQQPNCTATSIVKSIIAVPIYTFLLPLVFLTGQGRFMELVVKLCNHAGTLLYLMKINPIREEYVSD
jgi:predicted glycoside hydrolase/deacetylase ChbG (UPF0249 family)/glycosyltransferase involved in cell wall biosynthesis